MRNAFEYEAKYDKSGRPLERRWSVGPILISAITTLILALTGHSMWVGVTRLLQALK